jgi:hypothetical protein
MVKSISKRQDLSEEEKEVERNKTRAVRETWRDKPTNGMSLEERVERLEKIIAGEE